MGTDHRFQQLFPRISATKRDVFEPNRMSLTTVSKHGRRRKLVGNNWSCPLLPFAKTPQGETHFAFYRQPEIGKNRTGNSFIPVLLFPRGKEEKKAPPMRSDLRDFERQEERITETSHPRGPGNLLGYPRARRDSVQ